MLTWAYSLDSDKSLIQDFIPAVSGDTVATQTNGTAGVYAPTKYDVVSLNDQGRVCLATQAIPSGKTSPYLDASSVLGVCEGDNFQGLAAGGKYAAVYASNNDVSKSVAKVHTSTTDVYRIDIASGATAPVIGVTYSMYFDTNHGAQLDTANPSGSSQIFRVIGTNSAGTQAFGVFTSLELIN